METITAAGAIPFPADPVRTAVVQMYLEPGMIADQALPPTPPAAAKEFEYVKFRPGDAFEVPDTRLGRKSTPNEIEIPGDLVQGATEHHGLTDAVPLEDRDTAAANQGFPNPADTAVLLLTHLLKLAREVRTANAVFGAASYAAAFKTTLGANDKFDNDNSDPWGLLEDSINKPYFRPNTAVFGQEAWSKFRRHPSVLAATNRASGAKEGLARRADVAEQLEIDTLLVGRSRIASNAEGQDLALRRAWGDSVALIYRGAFNASGMPGGDAGSEGTGMPPMLGDRRMPTFGFTQVYVPLEVRSRINEGIGIKGAEEIVVRESCLEVISGGDGFGYLISDVLS